MEVSSKRLEEYRKTLPPIKLPPRKIFGNAKFVGSSDNMNNYIVSFATPNAQRKVYKPSTDNCSKLMTKWCTLDDISIDIAIEDEKKKNLNVTKQCNTM